ncbi:hypothetical protein [Clostridium lacusfryxellense]|uniref:hypothetical protein n=1 Tax=Clostridium lacusfryxellense TaxID=205328 RepID=UPI001C0BCFA1|nr:hypothetical protein [Clostridium lacusfryxellense]MBU3112595.1 hypothetical protein [Clostridium lacusfryxellense]
MMDLKSGISEIIGIKADDIPASIEYKVIESIKEDEYKRQHDHLNYTLQHL